MAKEKRSFFERLTGTVSLDDYEDSFEDEAAPARHLTPEHHNGGKQTSINGNGRSEWMEEGASEGQLSVDVFQGPDEIVIKAHVAGVKPEDLDVSITRDMVTIRGKREEHTEVQHDDYFYKELYWGSFSRTILLPQEIDTDQAEASEKHGLLTIRLPKIDKEKQTKLKVKG
jgi:HSP20 family protein